MPISNQEFENIIQRLEKNDPTLTSLNLGYKQIGKERAIRLAKALEHNTALTQLDLIYNGIGNEGANALAKVLQHNNTLTWLDLGGNDIDNEGASTLAKALEHNTAFTSLDLQHNGIGNEGVVEFAKALERHTTLTWFALSSMKYGNEAPASDRLIWDSLARNERLRKTRESDLIKAMIVLAQSPSRLPTDIFKLIMDITAKNLRINPASKEMVKWICAHMDKRKTNSQWQLTKWLAYSKNTNNLKIIPADSPIAPPRLMPSTEKSEEKNEQSSQEVPTSNPCVIKFNQ